MISATDVNQLSPEQLRGMVAGLQQELRRKDQEIHNKTLLNDKLIHELAVLKRHRFGRRSEGMNPDQASLLDDLVDGDNCRH